jgi:hypothetical protein
VLGTAGDSQPVEPLGVPRIGYPNPGVGYPQVDVYLLIQLGVAAGLLCGVTTVCLSSVLPSGLRRTGRHPRHSLKPRRPRFGLDRKGVGTRSDLP